MPTSLQQKTFSGVVWGFISNFTLRIFYFAQGIILARLLSPSDYGLVAMVAVFTAVAQLLVDSGFASALIRKHDKTDIDYSTVFDVNVVMSFCMAALLCAFSGVIAKFYNQPLLVKIVCLNAICMFFNSFFAVQGVKMSADLRFKEKNIMGTIVSVIQGLVSIGMAFAGFGVWSLVYPAFIAIPLNLLFYWHYQHWFPGIRFSRKSFNNLFGFGSKLLASGLIDTIYNNIYPIVIGKFFSSKDLGYYARSDGYANLPPTTVSGIISSVAYPILSEIQDDNDRLRNAYRKLLRLSAFILFPIMVGIAVLARPIIIVMITAKWEPCILLLEILCFAHMLRPIHSLNLNLLQVKGRSDLFLRLEIIKKIIGVSILCFTIPMGIVAMCAGSVLSSVLCLAVNTFYTGKMINMGYWKQVRDLVPALLYSLSMGLLVCLAVQPFSSDIAKLAVGIPLGVIYYFGVSYFTKSQDLAYLKVVFENNVVSRFKKGRG